MTSIHRPETDAALLERHRVADRQERARLLAQLLAGADMVTLHATGDFDCFVVSRVVAIDTESGTVDVEFTTDAARRAVFAAARGVVATALLARVTLQFDLDGIEILDDAGGTRLRAPLPVRLSRLQRREAFRVTPPTESTARLWLRGMPEAGTERRVPVVDVSATGLAFRLPQGDAAEPVVGTVFARSRLELPGTTPIFCDLVARTIEPGRASQRGSLRIGCELAGLDAAAQRAVQVFVNSTQTRGRRLRPGLR